MSVPFYFVRHGESEANIAQVVANQPEDPYPLTETGQAQAWKAAERLTLRPIAHVVTSPILRARQTAAIIATRAGRPYAIHDGLREFDCGVYEGRADPDTWAAMRRLDEAWQDEANWDQALPEGESFNDMRARFVPLVAHFLKLAPTLTGGVIFVAHGGLYRQMLPLVLANVDAAFARAQPLGYTDFVQAEPAGTQLTARLWAGKAL